MTVVIDAIGVDRLADYAQIPIVCDVQSILAIEEIDGGMGGLNFREQPLQVPYSKDYDAYADGGPLNWPRRFDISTWGLWIGHEDADVVGGVAVAWNTPGIQMLEGKHDLAVLWDIRVRASSRHQGVGTALFQEAVRWTKSKGCRLLKIETQNVNVVACRFYAKMGCSLGRIDRLAYKQCPGIAGEIMLIWHLDLLS
ncbi:MAG TPA: GNAT family N-acetyltransferase [Phycisphaerae bacterium]|nr:GNAT family N-acetyltransferase [Phycisphaerae bacterium]